MAFPPQDRFLDSCTDNVEPWLTCVHGRFFHHDIGRCCVRCVQFAGCGFGHAKISYFATDQLLRRGSHCLTPFVPLPQHQQALLSRFIYTDCLSLLFALGDPFNPSETIHEIQSSYQSLASSTSPVAPGCGAMSSPISSLQVRQPGVKKRRGVLQSE